VEKLPKFLQEEILEPIMESAAPASPKKQKQTIEVQQEEASGPPERIATLSSSAKQFPVTEATAPASPKKHKQTAEVPSKEVSKPPEHTITQTFPAKQVDRPRRTREEKGKDKVGNDVPPILVITSLFAISKAT
jgi:hypothetical protein